MRTRVGVAIALIGIGIYSWWRSSDVTEAPPHISNFATPIAPVIATPAAMPTVATAKAAVRAPSATTPSWQMLSSLLGQVGSTGFTLNRVLELLRDSAQEPLVVHDANSDTGEMLVVRTKNPLPGTRYFHAQYFADENGERFVQHMSFEIQPGPDAMAQAIAMVERNFPNLSRPIAEREDYRKWKFNDQYIVWIKRMTSADLADDPFNSYAASDDGTIRVAVELEIHGD